MVPSSTCCLNLFIRFASNALLVTIVRSADARKRKIRGTERDNAGAGDMPVSCIAHAAAVVRDARIFSALVTRDASGTILSRSSRSSPGTSPALSFFLSFSFSLFLFSSISPTRCTTWRASVISKFADAFSRVSRYVSRISRKREFLDRGRHRFSKKKNFARSGWRD